MSEEGWISFCHRYRRVRGGFLRFLAPLTVVVRGWPRFLQIRVSIGYEIDYILFVVEQCAHLRLYQDCSKSSDAETSIQW